MKLSFHLGFNSLWEAIWVTSLNIFLYRSTPPGPRVLEIQSKMLEAFGLKWVCDLKIPDILYDGPLTIQEIAKELRKKGPVHEANMYRFLRYVSSFELFDHLPNDTFALNKVSRALLSPEKSNGQFSLWSLMSVLFYDDWCPSLVMHWDDAILHGECPFKKQNGISIFDSLDKPGNEHKRKYFTDGMKAISQMGSIALPVDYDWCSYNDIVDIGGGSGVNLISILKRCPNTNGTLFDLPSIITLAKTEIAEREPEVFKRMKFVGGDFFKEIPSGHQVYIAKHVLHDWSDEEALIILKNIKKAGRPDSKFLSLEQVLVQDAFYDAKSGIDMMMMLTLKGKVRTEEEWKNLFVSAGLKYLRRVTVRAPTSIQENSIGE